MDFDDPSEIQKQKIIFEKSGQPDESAMKCRSFAVRKPL
jgi:hypothetical protein